LANLDWRGAAGYSTDFFSGLRATGRAIFCLDTTGG
jgi:hypothetical protein